MFYILYDKIRRLFIQLKLMLTRNGWKKAEWLKSEKRNNASCGNC